MEGDLNISGLTPEKNILYDRLVPVEWQEITTILGGNQGVALAWKKVIAAVRDCLRSTLDKVQHPFQLLGTQSGTPAAAIKLLNSRLPWQLAITSDGTLLAILKEDVLEIRTLLDGFEKIRASISVASDPLPQLRHLLWSQDGNLIAIGASNGLVQVLSLAGSGSILAQFRGSGENNNNNNTNNNTSSSNNSVVSLVFLPPQRGQPESVLALLCVLSSNGILDTYEIRTAEPVHLHSFDFGDYFPEGVGCLVYHHAYHLLLVGGDTHRYTYNEDEEGGPLCGISGWRLLDAAPYWGPRVGQRIEKVNRGYFSALISGKRGSRKHSGMLFDMSLNPAGTHLAAIDVSGNLSLWQVPSFRRVKSWDIQQLPISAKELDEEDKKVSPLPVQVSWWSDEALILGSSLGEVSVLSIHSLSNLLSGGHVTGWGLTPAINEQFFMLECDTRYVVERSRVPSLSDDSEQEEERDVFSLSRFSSNLVKQVLFYITDSPRFRTYSKKKIRMVTKKYRLTCVKSITPVEFFERKLRSEEYEEALKLAQDYELDSDMVYQRQWQSYQVSATTIHDYLSKVSKRSWVLQECLNRSTTDYSSTKNLLDYGLTRTTLKEMMELGGEADGPPLELAPVNMEEEEEQQQQQQMLEKLAEMDRLSPEQVSLCQYRHMLLSYLDRLSTYKVILEGSTSDKVFASKEYEVFRSENLVQSAVAFAREGDWRALKVLFTYHGDILLQHRLALLFNFPETTPPNAYCSLLPAASEDGEVDSWEHQNHREQDWVESSVVRKLCSLPDAMSNTNTGASSLYEENPDWEKYRGTLLAMEVVTEWYVTRATEIEEFSGQVDCALELVELGIKRGIKGLAKSHHELKTLSTLVYECNVDSRLSLKKFKVLSDLEVVELMMREEGMLVAEPDSGFARCVEMWLLPYLERLEATENGRSRGLLKNYLTQLSKGGLEGCLLILQQDSHASTTHHKPILPRSEERVEVVMSCVYSCDRSDQKQLSLANRIVEYLKSSSHDDYSTQTLEQLQDLETYISATEIFMSYGVCKPVHFLKDMQGSADEAQQLMVMLTRVASRRQPPMSEVEWQHLLEQLLSLKSTIFHSMDHVPCYKIYTESLLCCGRETNIYLAAQHLSLSPLPAADTAATPADDEWVEFKLSYDMSVELVVSAAKEYFNSSSSLMDADMDLARACLDLFPAPAPPNIQKELNLIASLSILDDFHVTLLPVQVRLCENRMDMVRAVLDSAPTAYRKHDKILHLCKLLDYEQSPVDVVKLPSSLVEEFGGQTTLSQAQGYSMIFIVLAALERKDYRLAVQLSSQLMQIQFPPAWEICRMMGLDTAVGDFDTRLKLLDFSITHCPAEEISSLLQSKQTLQLQLLCARCGAVGSHAETALSMPRSHGGGGGGRQSLVGRSVQQLVSKGAGAMQHLIGAKSSPSGVAKSSEVLVSDCLQSLRAAAVDAVMATVESEKEDDKMKLCYYPFYRPSQKPVFIYEDWVEAGVDSSQLFLHQTLLHGAQLAIPTGPKQSVECDQGLLKLSRLWSQKDTLMLLGSLLSIGEQSFLDEWISNVSASKFSLELVTYCICLHLYTATTSDLPSAPPPYQYPPTTLISHMIKVAKSRPLEEWNDQQRLWVEFLTRYRQLLADHSQANVLLKLGLGVDVGQFTQDQEYRHSIILTLARSSDLRLFSTALSLARRHGTDLWEVYVTLLDSLLTTSNSSVKEIQKKIEERDIMKFLLEKPQQSADYMRGTIYPGLPGHKYEVVLLYFTILQKFANEGAKFQETVSVDVHIKLLTKFKSAVHGFDYKLLMLGDSTQDPLLLLTPALSPNNVHVVAKLANKIPCGGGTALTSGMVMCAFALKLIWKGKGKSTNEVELMEHYEECREYLNLLTAEELHHFVLGTAMCKKSLQFSYAVRCELISKNIEVCKKLMTQRTTGKSKSELSYEELVGILERYLQHLKNMSHPTLQRGNVPEDTWKKLMVNFDLSLSEYQKVHAVGLDMILAGVSPEVLEVVLSMTRSVQSHDPAVKSPDQSSDPAQSHDLSAKTLYTEALVKSLSATEGLEQVEIILSCVSRHQSEGGSVVTSSDLLSVLRACCEDSSYPPLWRRALFALIDKYLTLSKEDQHLLNFNKTQSVLANKFSVEVDICDVSDPASQCALFSSLLRKSTSTDEYLTLCSLLDCWDNDVGRLAFLLTAGTVTWGLTELEHFVTRGFAYLTLPDCWDNDLGSVYPLAVTCRKRSGAFFVESWVDLLQAVIHAAELAVHTEAAAELAVHTEPAAELAVHTEPTAELAVFIRAGLKNIPLEIDEEIFAYMFNNSTSDALTYSLVCGNQQFLEKAINLLESHPSKYKHSDVLMELLLYRNTIVHLRTSGSFLYSRVYSYLRSPSAAQPDKIFFARLFRCPENEVMERLLLTSKAQRVRGVARQLYDSGFVMDAGALLVSTQSFHRELTTLNDALAYATKLFSN